MKNIPNTLKEHRLKANLSQMQVANAMGLMSNDRILKWEQGLMYPNIKNLGKLSKLYKVTPDKLYNFALSLDADLEKYSIK